MPSAPFALVFLLIAPLSAHGAPGEIAPGAPPLSIETGHRLPGDLPAAGAPRPDSTPARRTTQASDPEPAPPGGQIRVAEPPAIPPGSGSAVLESAADEPAIGRTIVESDPPPGPRPRAHGWSAVRPGMTVFDWALEATYAVFYLLSATVLVLAGLGLVLPIAGAVILLGRGAASSIARHLAKER